MLAAQPEGKRSSQKFLLLAVIGRGKLKSPTLNSLLLFFPAPGFCRPYTNAVAGPLGSGAARGALGRCCCPTPTAVAGCPALEASGDATAPPLQARCLGLGSVAKRGRRGQRAGRELASGEASGARGGCLPATRGLLETTGCAAARWKSAVTGVTAKRRALGRGFGEARVAAGLWFWIADQKEPLGSLGTFGCRGLTPGELRHASKEQIPPRTTASPEEETLCRSRRG